MRINKKPASIILNTYRLGPHSKGDDYRDRNEIEKFRKKDPLKLLSSKLNKNLIKKIETKVESRLDLEFNKAEKCDFTKDIKK